MNISYKKLPLVNLKAPRVVRHNSRTGNITSKELITQDLEDAKTVLKYADLNKDMCLENIIEAKEKYLVETKPDEAKVHLSKKAGISARQKGLRKPHYTRLLVFDNKLVFQAACCLALSVFAASLDGNSVSGRTLFNSYSEGKGGKLVYEFSGKGTEMIIDLKRGNSTRAQRLVFRI